MPGPGHVIDPRSGVGSWVRHEMAGRALGLFAMAAAERGIEWIPVKGVVTAHRLYADPAHRPMADIDIRVRPRDFGPVIAMGRARGWRSISTSPQLWHVELAVDGWSIDVEATVGPPGLCKLSVDSMIRRAATTRLPFGFVIREPEFHDHALLLCLNAFKDLLAPMPWAKEDLLRIGEDPLFDPSALAERARSGGVTTAVWLVADWLATDPRGVRWRHARQTLGPEPARRFLAHEYRRRASGPRTRADLFVVGAASDDAIAAARGVLFTLAGIVRGRIRRWRTAGPAS